jgi:hypothetical protein
MKKSLIALCATVVLFTGCPSSSGVDSRSTTPTESTTQAIPSTSLTTPVVSVPTERTTESRDEEAAEQHEKVCPHSAAAVTQTFKDESAAYVKSVRKGLAKGSAGGVTWSYIRVEPRDIAGLTPDGYRDEKNKNKTYLILATTSNSPEVDATFIAYPYGNPKGAAMFLMEGIHEERPPSFDTGSAPNASDLRRILNAGRTGTDDPYGLAGLNSRPSVASTLEGTFLQRLAGQARSGAGDIGQRQPRSVRVDVSATEDVLRRVGGATFALVEYPGGQMEFKDLITTNTIIARTADMPRKHNYERLEYINGQLLSSLPKESLYQLSSQDTLFITSARNSGGEELVTVYEPVSPDMPLVGHMFNLGKGRGESISRFEKFLAGRLRGLSKGGRVYWYGDDVTSVSIADIAYGSKADLIRRPVTIKKDIVFTDGRLAGSYRAQFSAETTVISDGIPTTEEHLMAMGRPLHEAEQWAEHGQRIRSMVDGRYRRVISTKEEFLHELQYGESDEIMLLAHSDGDHIYFGEERVSREEIEALPARQTPHPRTRAAMIISCEFGSLSEGRNQWLLWKQPKSFAELLVEKNFFDYVIAPDHLVDHEEAEAIVRVVLAEGTMTSIHRTHRGWNKVATLTLDYRQAVNRNELQLLSSQS